MNRLIVIATAVFLSIPPVFAEDTQDILDEIVALQGATPENESRLKELFEHPNKSVRVSAMSRMSQFYWTSGRIDEAEALLKQIMEKFDTYSSKYQVETLQLHSMFEGARNNNTEAASYASRAITIAETHYPALLDNSRVLLGQAWVGERKWLDAINILELAAHSFEKKDNLKGVFMANNALGTVYRNLEDFASSIKYLQVARKAVEQYGSQGHRASVYYNLGEIYLESQELEQAIEYYKKALAIDLELGDLGNAAYDYVSIANVYNTLDKYSKALEYNSKAIQNFIEVKAPQQLSRAYLQQARLYKAIEDQDNQFSSLLLAQKSALESKSSYQLLHTDFALGAYYLQNSQFNKAKTLLLEALKEAEQLSLDNDLRDIHESLATVYQGLGDYKNAVDSLNQHLELSQALNSEDQRERTERYKRDLNLLEERLKVSKLEQTKIVQAQQIQEQDALQQRLYLIVFVVLVISVTVSFLLWQKRRLSALKAKLYKNALDQKQALFADVSHELRTPLTALKLKIESLEYNLVPDVKAEYKELNAKVAEINRLITDIYQLARADSLSLELNKQMYSLNMVFKAWGKDWADLIESQGFAWEGNLKLGDGEIMLDAERIKQVIDNVLSNCIFYTDKPGAVKLTAVYQHKCLTVQIEDTAPSVESDKLTKVFDRLYRVESSINRQKSGSGLGLAICKSLIEAHNGSISAHQSKLGGLRIEFTIPG